MVPMTKTFAGTENFSPDKGKRPREQGTENNQNRKGHSRRCHGGTQSHNCIVSYAIDDVNVRPEWKELGFERAVEELKTNPPSIWAEEKGALRP